MSESSARRMRPTDQGAVRLGRPRREFAGEVEERILDAATKVFLERGFEGATIDELAEEARAGKPTIYARFPNKEALFAAVVARKVQENTRPESIAASGSTAEERLKGLATAIVGKTLAPDALGLMRVTLAEARRFPDLASSVSRMARERGVEAVARTLGELATTKDTGRLPAFTPDRLASTARRFLDAIMLPMIIRALFGEDPASLRAEIDSHVSQSVAFFLAACRYEGDRSKAG
ncbi:MAG TPA: TetR/AcrR family transcriptional regulator [Roseiarcus sp.]|nr:TetR/AcrR family transcriptional regulator [Roseiarcus sp.]